MTQRLLRQHEIMSQLVERKDADPCDMQQIFDDTAQVACDGLATSRVSIWLYNDDNTIVLCPSSFDSKDGRQDIFNDLILDKYPAYQKALQSGSIIIENNALLDPKTHELAKAGLITDNTHALFCLPIWIDGENIGHLRSEHMDAPRKWTLSDQNFAHSITDHIAKTIGNCRRNKAEQYLKESEQRYKLAISGSNDGIWDWDIPSNKIYRSPQYKKLLGYDDGEMGDTFDSWKAYIHPDDARRARAALDAHLTDENIAYEDEFRLQTKKGNYRWFLCRGSALRDDAGNPYRVLGSITDIHEFKYIQRSLNRFKQTLGEVNENIYMFDPETLKYFYANKSATDDIGYTEKELLDMTPVDIAPNYNEDTFRLLLSDLIVSPEQSLNFETVHQRKNGEQFTVEINLKYFSPNNSPPRFVGIVRDVSKRRKVDIENYIQRTMLEHIYKVQDDFISSEGHAPVFEQLLNGILDITESDFGLIGEVVYPEGESPYLYSRHITGITLDNKQDQARTSAKKNIKFKDLNNLLGEVIKRSRTVIVNDVANDTRPSGLPESCPSLESYMGIPLKLGEKLIGMIAIANRAEGYSRKTIRQLQPLLSTCANLLVAERAEKVRRSMEAALVEAKEEAEQANRTKSEFLSSMSHELRTPLNAIMGFAQLLQCDNSLLEAQKKHADVIYNAGDLLLDLINDVLDLAKIEAGRIDLSIEAVSIVSILKESFEYIKPLAEKHSIRLSLDNNTTGCPTCDDLWVRADSTRLKQILLNLLSNAIKYNRENGTVSVSCQITQQGMHRISITDSGHGINSKNLADLFQPFNRLGAQNGDVEGTGIGLVITRKLVELMGGSIGVESDYGKGATFMIDLPPAEIIKKIKAQTEAIDKNHLVATENKYHILVAEDNLINQQLIALQLDTLGYRSDIVDNGKTALEKLHDHNYDLLLTDIHMPEMDGYELTRATRESESRHIRDIKIIAVTANAATDEKKRCIETGMNDYLSKPININKLQHMLKLWLSVAEDKVTDEVTIKTNNTQKQPEKVVAITAKASNEDAIDISILERYVGNDTSKQKHFLKLFLDTSQKAIEEIQQAYLDQSLDDIESSCHRLKSPARTIGAIRVASLCQNMETASVAGDWTSIDAAITGIDTIMSEAENYIHEYLQKEKENRPTQLKI